jgi:hypothetical protein
MAHHRSPTAALRRPRAVWWAVLVALLFAIAPAKSLGMVAGQSD